jgi:hypothetical protein
VDTVYPGRKLGNFLVRRTAGTASSLRHFSLSSVTGGVAHSRYASGAGRYLISRNQRFLKEAKLLSLTKLSQPWITCSMGWKAPQAGSRTRERAALDVVTLRRNGRACEKTFPESRLPNYRRSTASAIGKT